MTRNEMVEPIYQTTRRHTPEDHDLMFYLSSVRDMNLVQCGQSVLCFVS
jgi:hypothetical protein